MSKYLLVSLPTSISLSNDHDEALTALRSVVGNDKATTVPFQIPEFKVGTLDALVQQADDLAKLANGAEGVVGKVGESLRNILEGDEDKIVEQKKVNDSMAIRDRYVRASGLTKCRAGGCLFEELQVEQGQVQSRQAAG